jgi:DNA-binding protein YbaB
MFDKLQSMNKLRKMKSEIDKQLEQIFSVKEKGDVKVVVRGDKKIERIEFDGEENKDLKNLINDALKDVEKKTEKQLKNQMGDLDLSSIFGGK